MLLTLIRKEIVSHILSLRFGVTFILFLLLVFASIYVTTADYKRGQEQYSAWTRLSAEQLAEAMKEPDPERRWRNVAYDRGRTDAVPLGPLSAVVQGLRPYMPAAINATTRRNRGIGEESGTNPLTGLLRIPDLVYIVSVVLSLLAILFAFDSVCGEKESGTLRLMLSNAVPRDKVLLAKWLGGYLVLIVPFLIAAAGGLGYARWQGALVLKGENLQRLGMLLAVACLYISVFFTLSLFVSTITHRAATALFICLLIWVGWILVIPNLAPVVAKIVHPAPSMKKINAEKEALDQEYELRIERLTLISGKLRYGKETEKQREQLEDEREREKRRWDRFYEDATRRQTQLAETLARISPLGCWTYAAVALTDSGPEAHRRLAKAAENLQKAMEDFAHRLRQTEREARGPQESSQGGPTFTAEEVPRLHVAAAPFGETMGSVARTDILILAILNAVFFLAAFVLFLFYDVR